MRFVNQVAILVAAALFMPPLSGSNLRAALIIERAQGDLLTPRLEQARLDWREASELFDQTQQRISQVRERLAKAETDQRSARAELLTTNAYIHQFQYDQAIRINRQKAIGRDIELLRSSLARPMAKIAVARQSGRENGELLSLEATVKALLSQLHKLELSFADLQSGIADHRRQSHLALTQSSILSVELAGYREERHLLQGEFDALQGDLSVWRDLADQRQANLQQINTITAALEQERLLTIRPKHARYSSSWRVRAMRQWPSMGDGTGTPRQDSPAPLVYMPVDGQITSQFGEVREAPLDKGIIIEANNGSRVVAPRSGKVVFAGPFQNYGQLLIIDHRDGYHTLLSGFDWLGVSEEAEVEAGQLVGSLASDKNGNSWLYLELRRRGKPANPLPWLAARSDKVRG